MHVNVSIAVIYIGHWKNKNAVWLFLLLTN